MTKTELANYLQQQVEKLKPLVEILIKGSDEERSSRMTDKEKLTVEFTIEKYLQYANEQEARLLDLIINYYRSIYIKGIENIKVETVVDDLEEIKKQFTKENNK